MWLIICIFIWFYVSITSANKLRANCVSNQHGFYGKPPSFFTAASFVLCTPGMGVNLWGAPPSLRLWRGRKSPMCESYPTS